MFDLGMFIDVPILVIVYLIIEFAKKFILKTDKQKAYIPVISTILGGIISVVIFLTNPMLSTNANVLNAFASGAISGSAATGTNQIFKQLKKSMTIEY